MPGLSNSELENLRRLSRKDDDDPVLVGEVWGDYEVLQELGRGATSEVHQARHRKTGQLVALKIVKKLPEKQEQLKERFKREAKLLAAARHPSVVKVHDAGDNEGRLYIAMELVRGESLEQKVLRQGRIGDVEATRLLKALVAGLLHIHERGILHRDLSPRNILLRDGRVPVIVDFGIGRGEGGDQRLTLDGSPIGTPGFMSPEQAEGKVSGADERSDLSSLGCLMYFMLTGRPPFAGETAWDSLKATLEKEPEPPRSRRLSGICMKLLKKAPEERYQSALEVFEDLVQSEVRARERVRTILTSSLAITAAFLALVIVARIRKQEATVPPSPVRSYAPLGREGMLGSWKWDRKAIEEYLDDGSVVSDGARIAPWSGTWTLGPSGLSITQTSIGGSPVSRPQPQTYAVTCCLADSEIHLIRADGTVCRGTRTTEWILSEEEFVRQQALTAPPKTQDNLIAEFVMAKIAFGNGDCRESIVPLKRLFYAYPEHPIGRECAYWVARAYSILVDRSKALEWLDRSVTFGYGALASEQVAIKRDQVLELLQKPDSSRFDAIVARALKGRGCFGLQVEEADGRVRVAKIVPGSPAEKAGVRRGDLILGVNGRPLHTTFDFLERERACDVHSTATLSIRRSKDPLEVQLVAGPLVK